MAFRRWVWCEDTCTGHRFDVDERSLPRLLAEGAVKVVPGYPVNEGPNASPRRAKPRLDVADLVPAAPPTAPAPPAAPAARRRPRKATPAPAVQPADETTTTSAEGAEQQ